MNQSYNPFDAIEAGQNRLEGMLREIINRPTVTTAQEEQPVGIEKAAELLGLSVGGVRKNLARIPHRLTHRRYYFFPSELIAYIHNAPGVKTTDGLGKRKTPTDR